MKKEILEELLKMSENNCGHSKAIQPHEKFDILSKYFYVYSKGQKSNHGTTEEHDGE